MPNLMMSIELLTKGKNRFLILVMSLMIIPIWGLSFLAVDYANQLTVFYGLFFTLILFRWLRVNLKKEDRFFYLLALVGPIFYFLSFIFFQASLPLFQIILSPLVFGLLIVVFALLVSWNNKIFFSISIVGILFYSLVGFPKLLNLEEFSSLSFDQLIEKQEELSRLDLRDFPSLFAEIKDKQVRNVDYILIETWNEKCKPCLSSMSDLQKFMKDKKNVLHIFLYQEMGSQNLTEQGVKSFKLIIDKQNILIDKNNELYERLGLSSYPYFLIYDASGKQLDWFSGYLPYFKDEYERHLNRIFAY